MVIARDLLSRFLGKGSLTDPAFTKRYVESILSPPNSCTAAELIHAFFGEGFRFDAFERWAFADPFRTREAGVAPSGPARTAGSPLSPHRRAPPGRTRLASLERTGQEVRPRGAGQQKRRIERHGVARRQ